MGRLFDAVAVLLGGRTTVSYEAQAAIELESAARRVARRDAPRLDGLVTTERSGGMVVLDPAPLLARLVADRAADAPVQPLAAAFHEAIGLAAATVAAEVARERGIDAVVLTGGVFQNARLTEVAERALADHGLRVLVHERVPPNDGGLSIGQAAIAAAERVAGGHDARNGGAAPRPMPQLMPPRRPSSRMSGPRTSKVASSGSGSSPWFIAMHGARNGHRTQCPHDGCGSTRTSGSIMSHAASASRRAAPAFSVRRARDGAASERREDRAATRCTARR